MQRLNTNIFGDGEKAKGMFPVPQAGDYYKDDLLYCGKCDTPRQGIYGAFGKQQVLCACREAEETEKEKRKKREQLIERIPDKSLIRHSFADDDHRYDISAAYDYVEHWEEYFAANKGMMLMGDVGVGKSFMASCIVNALIDKGIYANIFTLGDLINVLGAFNPCEPLRESYRGKLKYAKLIVIDEFDLTQKTDHYIQVCFDMIDMRYREERPIILTTNLMPEEIKNETNMMKRKIYDRLKTCRVEVIGGESRRR